MSDSVVYFIQPSPGGPVKIGTCRSDRLRLRLSELQSGNAQKLVVRHVEDGGRELEQWIHEQLSHLRIRGEWFGPGDDVLWHFEVDSCGWDWRSE